jgi:hypothetical protein
MNREEASNLLKFYKDFPQTSFFSLRPINYPMFHILECFCKGWTIEASGFTLTNEKVRYPIENIDFEKLARECSKNIHTTWPLVARNPRVTNSMIGFVQEDLYARYVGQCNPLKGPNTSWTFIPEEKANKYPDFFGVIGKNTKLYQIEIDLDTTDVIGTWDDNVPWHYLQQTINWKPWTRSIDWNEGVEIENTNGRNETLRERFNRVRFGHV